MRLRLLFAYTATMPDVTQPGNPEPQLSADDRLILMLAGIIAAQMVAAFDEREFRGFRSPRFESAMDRSLAVARSLLRRHRDWLRQQARSS